MSTNFWLGMLLGFVLGQLVALGMFAYLHKRSERIEEKAKKEKAKKEEATEQLRALLVGRPDICGRCGLRVKEAGSSMCAWCGI